ncbi:MAG: hypothetical protein MUE85_15205 [Microscillaceae bacterium]|jgi:hypothetical protein|nr:hypothetical protein [Microscillaceae bacterium]
MKKLRLFNQNPLKRRLFFIVLSSSWTMSVWAASPPNHGEPDDKRKTASDSEKSFVKPSVTLLNKKNTPTNSDPKSPKTIKKKQTSAVLLPLVIPVKTVYY